MRTRFLLYYPVPCGTDLECELRNWWWDWLLGEN